MKLGAFFMPSHPPERGIKAAHDWDLAEIEYMDKIGFDDAWIGEHFTAPWEPIVAPDIMVALALARTNNITMAMAGHLLPYYHPAVLAHRVAYLDHIAQGRLIFGVTSGGVPTDWQMFDTKNLGSLNREKTRESIEIILKFWNEKGPWQYDGKFWNVSKPEPMVDTLRYHMEPFQKPHPRIAIAGLSPASPTLNLAGEFGLMPLSIAFSHRHLDTHWDSVLRGAEVTGREPSRADWRINTPVFVAETDEEAYRLVVEGPIGKAFDEYLLPLWKWAGLINAFKERDDAPDDSVTVANMARDTWLVGSPETVAQKFIALHERVGGFGGILASVFDHSEPQHEEAWHHSLDLLANQVMPNVRKQLATAK